MNPVSSPRARRRTAGWIACLAAAGVALAGCAGADPRPAATAALPANSAPASPWTPAAPGSGGSAPASGAAASSQTLLDKADLTVLGQQFDYPQTDDAQVSSAIVTIPVGGQTGRHRHNTPMYAYVLAGTVTVEYDGGVVKEIPAGTALVEAVGTWHNGRNLGGEPVAILTVNLGAQGLVNTEKAG